MSHKILLTGLRAVAKQRPLGYYEDVIRSGRVEKDVLFVEDDSYTKLCEKYTPKKEPTQVIIAFSKDPGTELKKLLLRFGLKPAANCKCIQHINEMNQKGVIWCEQNIDTILGWLKEEADRAKLPFTNIGARIIVKRAIHNAKKK